MNTVSSHSFGDIVRRLALPFLLFTAVLCSLLSLSYYLLLPQLTHITVAGVSRELPDLKAYRAQLQQQISGLEQERRQFLLPVHNELYLKLKAQKHGRVRYQELRQQVGAISRSLITNQTNAVQIAGYQYNAQQNTFTLTGRIHNVGPRSMTVLAQLIEELGTIEQVTHVHSSRYTRLQNEDGTFYSPFTIRLTLQP